MRLRHLVAGAILWMVTAHVSAETAARVALLIGNAAYADAPLRNPINDVREVGQMLRAIGFKVTTRENLRRDEMRDALRGFLLTHRSADVRLVYYAGHGLQMRGRSYLLPVGAAVHSERDVLERTVDATELVEQLGEIKHGANLVVIDACRVAAMFEAQTRDLWAARPGLARVPAPRGTVVAFSTRPGHVARDGDQAMSIYARHFTRTLEKVPELPVEAFFKRVRAGVVAETRNRQVPWESSDLNGELCFRPNADGRCRRSPPG